MQNSRAKRRAIPLVVFAMLSTAAVLIVMALDSFLRYSPYGDPGAIRTGLWLGLTGLAIIVIPAGIALIVFAVAAWRRYAAWKGQLTPGQQDAVSLAEAAALEGAHLAWHRHNQEEDARLTESVMGRSRDGEQQ
ncbi:MAG: hypothetical protein JWM19_998 [Actinomycetia bacterium]|nr:hypothetical protein [Actinomycetes bacterium]